MVCEACGRSKAVRRCTRYQEAIPRRVSEVVKHEAYNLCAACAKRIQEAMDQTVSLIRSGYVR